MPARSSYTPPSAETVLDISDDERAKHLASVDSAVSPNTPAKKLSKRREKEKEDVVPNSSRSSGERRRRHSFRGPERPERTQPSPTPKPASLKQSKIRQAFTHNFSELQSEVGRKSPRPDRVAEVKARDIISQHRRTASTGSLKTAYVASADKYNDEQTDESRMVKKSNSVMYNNSDHPRSIGTTLPPAISSGYSSISGTTTTSNNSSGSNSTVTQDSVVSGTLRRTEKSINDLIRQRDVNLTPRAREMLSSSNGTPDVFAFQDDSSETSSIYPSDATGTAVDQLSTSHGSSRNPSARNSESNSSRPLNKSTHQSQNRNHGEIGTQNWPRQDWLRHQAEQSSIGVQPHNATASLRTPENIASSVRRSSVDPAGRDSPTGSTSSGTRSNSTSGTVGDTDTARSSSPEPSSKSCGIDSGNRKHTLKEKTSARATLEPVFTRHRERSTTVNTHSSSRSKPESSSKVSTTPRTASASLPCRDITGPDVTAMASNEKRRTSSQGCRGSISTSATADTLTAKIRPSETTSPTGDHNPKYKILPIPAIQAPQKLNSRETSPERFYRPPDTSPNIPHKQTPRNPPPQYQVASDGHGRQAADVTHLYPPHQQPFYPVQFDSQAGFSAPFAPPTPDFLQMPGMMLPGRYPGTPIPPYRMPSSPISFRSSTPFDLSKPSTSNHDLLASHLSGTTEKVIPLYRRFAFLNHRILLHLQSELADLEAELRHIDAAAAGASPSPGISANPELEFQRIEILGQVFVKVGQYNQALTSFSTVASQPSATPHLLQSYKRFLTTHTPATSHSFLAEPADLLAVTSGPRPPPTNYLDSHENYTPILLLLAAVAIVVPVLVFGVIPNWLGRMAFVGVVASALAVVLRDKEGEAGVLGDGWEKSVVVAGYVGIMGVLAGVVA